MAMSPDLLMVQHLAQRPGACTATTRSSCAIIAPRSQSGQVVRPRGFRAATLARL